MLARRLRASLLDFHPGSPLLDGVDADQVCVVSLTPAARRHVKEQQDGEDILSGGLGIGHGSWQVHMELGRQLQASAA